MRVLHVKDDSRELMFRMSVLGRKPELLVSEAKRLLAQGDYEIVAVIDKDDYLTTELALEDAFRLTNNIDGSWRDNVGVYAVDKAVDGCRSTSVGDVVKYNGIYFVCASFGWEPVL